MTNAVSDVFYTADQNPSIDSSEKAENGKVAIFCTLVLINSFSKFLIYLW